MRLKEIEPGMVIHCKTEEEADALMVELERLDYVWGSLVKPTHHSNWGRYRKETCYRLENGIFGFADRGYYSNAYKITEFSDLIIPELSAKEVLETMKEICKHHDCACYSCSFRGSCDPTEDSSEKIIEICTKWREEHPKEEKKELETEWVYVVRIIKVHDNGKKECVSEIEAGESRDGIEDKIERGLKLYSENHKGNFFATLEHICRIKE